MKFKITNIYSQYLFQSAFFWETLGFTQFANVYHLLKHYCRPHAPLMSKVVFDGYLLFQQDNIPCRWFEEHDEVEGTDSASQFPRSQSNQTSVQCAGKTSFTHGGFTSQPTDLKDLLQTSFQRSGGVHALMDQSCFGRKFCWTYIYNEIANQHMMQHIGVFYSLFPLFWVQTSRQ